MFFDALIVIVTPELNMFVGALIVIVLCQKLSASLDFSQLLAKDLQFMPLILHTNTVTYDVIVLDLHVSS